MSCNSPPNYLGHFALTTGLRPALAAAGGARIVSLSSNAHLYSPVVFGDLDFRFRPYDPRQAYAESKTAMVLLAVEATRPSPTMPSIPGTPNCSGGCPRRWLAGVAAKAAGQAGSRSAITAMSSEPSPGQPPARS